MKVLYIVDHAGGGGAQTLAKAICGRRKGSYYYALRRKGNGPQISGENFFCRDSRSRFDVRSLFELKRIIKEKNINILHCQLVKSFVTGYLLKKLFFRNIKLIFHEQGKIFRKQFFYTLFLRSTRGEVDRFIACSEATKRKLTEFAGISAREVEVVYNCVDLDTFGSGRDFREERESMGIRENCFVAGFAGRLVRRKGWEEFIKAGKIVSGRHADFRLLIAGDGPDRGRMLDLAEKLQISDRVVYLGGVDRMARFYGLLNCFVIPSHWEPMGMVAIEAQACGIPVIASDVEGLNEIVVDGENGLLFTAKKEKELAEKIILLRTDGGISGRLSENGLKNIDRYSLNNYLEKTGRIYEKVLKWGT